MKQQFNLFVLICAFPKRFLSKERVLKLD